MMALLTLISCGDTEHGAITAGQTTTTQPKNELEKTSWLLGVWKSDNPEGIAYEVWHRENDSVFSGRSYMVKGHDTLPQETMTLQQNGNETYYIPIVNGQNNGQPVLFKMMPAAEATLVFENPEHDFPQKITYTKVGEDSLVAAISGKINGETHTEEFPMRRVK